MKFLLFSLFLSLASAGEHSKAHYGNEMHYGGHDESPNYNMMDRMMHWMKPKEKRMWVMDKMFSKTEFFEATGPEDTCSEVPTGDLTRDPREMGCRMGIDLEERCFCVRVHQYILDNAKEMSMMPPKGTNDATGFALQCGKCENPCALKWKPEMDKKEKSNLGSKLFYDNAFLY